MRVVHPLLLVLAFGSGASAQTPASSLDFEFFKTRVQPIFLAERPGHARCIACHGSGTPLRLQPLAAGRATWTDEESRKNFDAVRRMVVPGSAKSRLLMHPLAEAAGGDFYHNGGKHWNAQSDPEWLTIKAWVMGDTLSAAAARHPRIIQTNSAGDNVHLIDPATNTVVGIIRGIEAGHGAGAAPDGSRIYVSDEAESTLDVVDAKSLAIVKKVPLSGHPNNMAVSKDGRRVYVGIAQEPGGVDVIDTASMQRVKTVPTQGAIHNAYVTPDGRFVVAGSIPGATINVIDAATEEPAWTLKMDLGIRPMTFSTNPDGSTKWIFAQLTGLNGFAVVDFTTRKEIRRVENPPLPPGKMTVPEGSDPSHGMAVTADGQTLVVCSRLNNYLYSYSLPDLKLLGSAELGGKGAGWVTLTPDGRTAYVANPVTNDVSVVDLASMKETTRIPVGFVPKRNVTVSLQ
ncbi:MAG TPA: cytochrome D1 domain-containing protein [Vicinamibacterales bacterium]|nr:cytochrome D1 domain-containing protein [Vicinamibacterales bacterium]